MAAVRGLSAAQERAVRRLAREEALEVTRDELVAWLGSPSDTRALQLRLGAVAERSAIAAAERRLDHAERAAGRAAGREGS